MNDPDTSPTLAVVEEQLVVGKSTEQIGAVRVRIEVDRSEQTLELEEVREEVDIERVRKDLPAAVRRDPWMEEGTLVVPVYEQRAVLETRLVLAEELRITRRRHSSRQPRQVPLRKERAVIERQQADGSWVEQIAPGDKEGPP